MTPAPKRRPLSHSTMKTNNTANQFTALSALRQGIPPSRRLTRLEREFVAIRFHSPPPLSIVFSSSNHTLDGTRRAWANLRKRLERYRTKRGRHGEAPLIYIATAAVTLQANGGHHMHVLVWNEHVELKVLRPRAIECGFGPPRISKIVADVTNPCAADTQIAYVLEQHRPIFGSTNHLANAPLAPGQQMLWTPSRKTLKLYKPELLSALDMAKDQSITDNKLV